MIQNSNKFLFDARGTTVTRWGKDQTGTINYKLNNQGFRGDQDYDRSPSYAFFGSSAIFGIGINNKDILVNQFDNSQNYGLAGEYLNQDSITNLKNFLKSNLYTNTRIVFFWVERNNEDIPTLVKYIDALAPNVLHISQGPQYPGLINLMPQIDQDVSNTHPGPQTHRLWANTIKALFANES